MLSMPKRCRGFPPFEFDSLSHLLLHVCDFPAVRLRAPGRVGVYASCCFITGFLPNWWLLSTVRCVPNVNFLSSGYMLPAARIQGFVAERMQDLYPTDMKFLLHGCGTPSTRIKTSYHTKVGFPVPRRWGLSPGRMRASLLYGYEIP